MVKSQCCILLSFFVTVTRAGSVVTALSRCILKRTFVYRVIRKLAVVSTLFFPYLPALKSKPHVIFLLLYFFFPSITTTRYTRISQAASVVVVLWSHGGLPRWLGKHWHYLWGHRFSVCKPLYSGHHGGSFGTLESRWHHGFEQRFAFVLPYSLWSRIQRNSRKNENRMWT